MRSTTKRVFTSTIRGLLHPADNEKILNEAREERSRMLREAKDAKDQIITEAREKANAEYNRIVDEAKGAINNQKMAALIEIKNNVGNMVLEV